MLSSIGLIIKLMLRNIKSNFPPKWFPRKQIYHPFWRTRANNFDGELTSTNMNSRKYPNC